MHILYAKCSLDCGTKINKLFSFIQRTIGPKKRSSHVCKLCFKQRTLEKK